MSLRVDNSARRRPGRGAGFTLVELLAVISIIATLIGLILPAISKARAAGRSAVCQSQLKGLMTAAIMYSSENADAVLPSYNMRGVAASLTNPLDGWAPILAKFGYAVGHRSIAGNIFCCPDTLDLAGMAAGQTGSDLDRPRGYMDWPAVITISQNYGAPIPSMGFEQVIRVGYWINGDNLIGAPRLIEPGIHFTGSVGYGPDPTGRMMGFQQYGSFKKPSQLIAFADGLYAGKQAATRLGDRDSRIGYRHPGPTARANLGFADGHAGSICGDQFPRRAADGLTIDEVRDENLGDRPTVYTDPERFLLPGS